MSEVPIITGIIDGDELIIPSSDQSYVVSLCSSCMKKVSESQTNTAIALALSLHKISEIAFVLVSVDDFFDFESE